MQSLADHIFEREDQGIGLKTAIMEYAAMSRGLSYTRPDRSIIVVEPPDGPSLPFNNMNGPSSSYVSRQLSNRKSVSRALVADAGLSVPTTRTFRKRQFEQAWSLASTLPGGAVVKPLWLSRGRGVTTSITTREAFEAAWTRAFEAYRTSRSGLEVMVEENITGEDFRCFAVGGKFISATQRRRPSVVGDGHSTVSDLMAQKNEVRAASPTLHTYPIPTELENLDRLVAQGWGLDDVPAAGETIVLRSTSNLSGGGDSVDYTDYIHPTFQEIVIRAIDAIPGIEYLGVDIIARSLAVEPTATDYVVTEVEFSPGPITDFPVEGEPRDMAGPILEYYLNRGPAPAVPRPPRIRWGARR